MALVELFGETLVSKDGEVATKDAVAGKTTIMIYFSAHWCPPCRGFTPQLAQQYKDSDKAGKDVMVIFVSSDKDQASFDEYYGSMPWHALPFAQRDLKNTISEKFEVKGIPMLVVLDGEGKLVSANGRAEYKTYLPAGAAAAPAAEPAAAPAAAPADAPAAAPAAGGSPFADLFGEKLVSKDGPVATADAVAGKSNVLVYFSAHWCPPCRGFTPQLAQAYKDSAAAGKSVICVFVSSDRDQAAFDEYYGEMPWHALPFSERDLKGKISEKYDVKGIPSLIVLDGEGKLVTANGRAEYAKYLTPGEEAERRSNADAEGAKPADPKAACCVVS